MPVVGKPNNAQGIAPSDAVGLRDPTTHLSFTDPTGGAGMGTVFIDTIGGQVNVGITLPAGLWPICATRVRATGTTATNIVGYWDF